MSTEQVAGPAVLETPMCDLVMKGGITSGVIYPKLIHQLSLRYRFKNIGGTSAGAIAAGACAAAEYGRRRGQNTAFDRLNGLPEELGELVEPSKRSRLLTLFQPDPSLQTHFAVLLQALNQQPRSAIARMLFRLLANHAVLAATGLLLGAALLAPLVRTLSLPTSGWAAFGTALVALIFVGLFMRWAGPNAGVRSILLIGLAISLLFTSGLTVLVGAPWDWSLVWVTGSLLVGSLLIWVLLIGITAWRFVVTFLTGLHGNGYGLCSGRTMAAPKGATESLPGLTDWLTGYLDELAGISARAHPLTFGDLWGGPDRHATTAVNLEVMTSAVSQQMIYGIPFREGTPTLYYDPSELKRLFPPRVVDWIESVATAAEQVGNKNLRPDDYAGDTTIQSHGGRKLRPFPRGADLPVVVAVRMSLSFPVLLSAVPLYSVDFSRTKNQDEKKRMRAAMKEGKAPMAIFIATRIWFSDGGIGSNMPLHMFDSLLPGHPTFAVNLKAEHPDKPIGERETKANADGRIFLPENNRSGALRHWAEPADGGPLDGLLGFLSSIVKTMQNWRDEIQFPYPGFKDRIVQISQRMTEGGLNLDMPKPAIDALSNAGGMAAERLIARFHPFGEQRGEGWKNHQTIRLGTFLGTMQPGAAALCPTISTGHWASLAKTIAPYTVAEQRLAQDFLVALGGLGELGQQKDSENTSLESGALRPVAQIRITPKI